MIARLEARYSRPNNLYNTCTLVPQHHRPHPYRAISPQNMVIRMAQTHSRHLHKQLTGLGFIKIQFFNNQWFTRFI
jgi:hypothetical protein